MVVHFDENVGAFWDVERYSFVVREMSFHHFGEQPIKVCFDSKFCARFAGHTPVVPDDGLHMDFAELVCQQVNGCCYLF